MEAVWESFKPIVTLASEQQEELDKHKHLREKDLQKQRDLLDQQEQLNNKLAGMISCLTKETKGVAEGQAQLTRELELAHTLNTGLTLTMEQLTATNASAEAAMGNTAPPPPTSVEPTQPLYTTMVVRILLAFHASTVAKQDAQCRRVLVDIKNGGSTELGEILTEEVYVQKAQMAINLMHTDGLTPPDNSHFLTVRSCTAAPYSMNSTQKRAPPGSRK